MCSLGNWVWFEDHVWRPLLNLQLCLQLCKQCTNSQLVCRKWRTEWLVCIKLIKREPYVIGALVHFHVWFCACYVNQVCIILCDVIMHACVFSKDIWLMNIVPVEKHTLLITVQILPLELFVWNSISCS